MSSSDIPETHPTGPIAKSGIELLTFGTPNGYKASIIMEELKEAYGRDYTCQVINIRQDVQKKPWYTAINPNGRIPVIIDHDRHGFIVFETAAILSYLVRHYDPNHKLSFSDPDDTSTMEQWMLWQHGGLGPIQGQANFFLRGAKEKVPFGIQRYIGESERLYGVLNARLEGRDFVAGAGRGKYSIADISIFGWVNFASFGAMDLTMFPNIQMWLDKINARPGVQNGLRIPFPPPFANASYATKMREDSEFQVSEGKAMDLVKQAKEQYGYKYKSP
jgi:glutathione S-transferase